MGVGWKDIDFGRSLEKRRLYPVQSSNSRNWGATVIESHAAHTRVAQGIGPRRSAWPVWLICQILLNRFWSMEN